MPTLNYYQTLDIIEAFMIKSGIRTYCTNICKGMCCGRCYTGKNACHKHEGRRISCSVYTCFFGVKGRGKDLFGPFKAALRIINDEAERSFSKYKSGNRYFTPPPKRMFKEFMIQGWPPHYPYLTDKTRVEIVKVGLCLEYAAKIRVIMNKIIRLAQDLLKSTIHPGLSFKDNPRLTRFEAKRIKRWRKLEWEVKYWRAKEWV